MGDLQELVRRELEEYHKTVDELKNELTHQGYLEKEVDAALYHAARSAQGTRQSDIRRKNRIFTVKELFDRIGYGATSVQLLTILLFQIGGGYFLIGLLSGMRTVVSTLFSAVFHEYGKVRPMGKKFVGAAGIAFGFSFLLLAAGVALRSVPLFVFAFLVGIVGVIAHGEPYTILVERHLKKEHMNPVLARIGMMGVIIIAASLCVTAYLFDAYPVTGMSATMNLFGQTFSVEVYGFLLAFEVTAILFILSGYLLSFIDEQLPASTVRFASFAKEYYQKSRLYLRVFGKNSFTRLMLLGAIITSLVQVLGTAYYGVVIYQNFAHTGFGAYLNVALVFTIALVSSMVGAAFTPWLSREIGEAPVLVFGTLLMAMLPLALIYNPNLYAVGLACTLSVIGGSMSSMSQGLFIRRILTAENAKMYFNSVSLATTLPLIVLIPLGSYVAASYGPQYLFKILAGLLIAIVMPLYFVIVVKTNKWNQKAVIAQMSQKGRLTYN